MTVTGRHYQSEFARRYFSQGEAQAVLAVLEVRGIEVPDAVRDKITTCSDLDQLGVWVRRAAIANKIEDVDEGFQTPR